MCKSIPKDRNVHELLKRWPYFVISWKLKLSKLEKFAVKIIFLISNTTRNACWGPAQIQQSTCAGTIKSLGWPGALAAGAQR